MSTDPTRSIAGMSGLTLPLAKRTTDGPSVIASASRSSARSVGSSRGAARDNPGTSWRKDMSHIPLWDGPSSPVTPARSRTKVTGSRCMATSINTWSKARLRKVA